MHLYFFPLHFKCVWFLMGRESDFAFILLLLKTQGVKLLKASLGSVDFITSFCKSEDESEKIKDAVNSSSYGSEFVHAALSVNKKVIFFSNAFLFLLCCFCFGGVCVCGWWCWGG